MGHKKIVFFINVVSLTRCIKRIDEFIDNGYEVEAYGFERDDEAYIRPSRFDINVLGRLNTSQNYFSRSRIIYRKMKPIIEKYRKQDVLFYYFFYDVAIIARLISNKVFIYEESDMPYTKIRNSFLRNIMKKIDKRMINHSLLTVMTSEGFVDYHYGNIRPENIVIVPNRVNPRLKEYKYHSNDMDINHLRFSFVGGFRYHSVMNFATVIAEKFPQHEFHSYGNIIGNKAAFEKLVKNYGNIFYHGLFKNPEDLSDIYEQTDIVLATYDATSINAQYAEPNKLYESIFFRTPIVVSSNTFLAKKVKRLNIGFDINGLNKEEIEKFINGLTSEVLSAKQIAILSIPQDDAINYNPELFKYLESV